MICQICSKNPATVHITEIALEGTESGTPSQKHVCETCAQMTNLPHMPVAQKGMVNIWKLLQQSAQKARQEGGLACPDCGMTLAEFRSKGRLGCPRDYEVFQQHLDPLIHRIHNSIQHEGRLPGLGEDQLHQMHQITTLRAQLEEAIREEAYEDAARLRDELQDLEQAPPQSK